METEITLAEFRAGYASDEIFDVINLKVGSEQRIYGKTRINAGDEPNGQRVVYAVL